METRCSTTTPSAPLAPRRWRRRARLAAGAGGWLLAIALFLPASVGGRASWVVVSGHSMEPTYHSYDLAFAVRTGTVEVGDVIVYRVPEGDPGAGHQVIHRVIGGDATRGYTTQGDNRDSPDIWHPRPRDVVGRVVVILPQGYKFLAALFDVHNVGLVALVLLAWAIWPRADATADEAPRGLVGG